MLTYNQNNMKLDQIIQVAVHEMEAKAWGITKQFLEIHDPVYENTKLLLIDSLMREVYFMYSRPPLEHL
jgi:hypothetical protein